MEEKKLTDELEEMYVSGKCKFNGEVIFNAIKTIYALQEENAELQKQVDGWVRVHDEQLHCMQVLTIENNNLQKQVDEMTDHLSEKQNALWDLQDDFDNLLAEGKQQAVKDTAKEICSKIIKGQPQPIQEKWLEWFKKEYGVEVE